MTVSEIGISSGQVSAANGRALTAPCFTIHNCQRHSSQSKEPELHKAKRSSHHIESLRCKRTGLKGAKGNEVFVSVVTTAGLNSCSK